MSASTFYRQIGLESKLPSLNKKLDKKNFYDYVDLNRKEKDVITKAIERMELTFLLTPSTINIQPFINEEFHYEGIMFITIQLRETATDKQISVIDEVIHGTLPNPTINVFQMNNNDILISTCMKRLNKVNRSSVVLGEIHHTTWINLDYQTQIVKDFIQSVHLTKINFANFYEFYKDIDIAVQAFQNANIIGNFQIVKDEQQRLQKQLLIQQISVCETEISKLKTAIKKETQFNKKVEFNVKIYQLQKKIAELKQQLTL
ncbi:DUF4391 domain-containing protein [Tepidibacillus fermentans]|uniref:Uncharacterized protein DUF4391 n=1 Tax=Tepidibacillus fermentans TaxID=1281767 RepID=A0A4R3KLM0_9BACI|nr:DUF4391 domain-containing protein [Tepidibacillus fermentans]TCS84502.1 uncharacterized protein DUF4391 [Tepidibacillus fermentans]